MKQLRLWLNRPYPLLEQRSSKWILVLGFALFTYLFLLLYQPFGAAEIPGKTWYLSGFGVSVFVVLAFNYFLLPRLAPSWFKAEDWQIKKEILYVSWCFLGIAVLNYVYNTSVGHDIAPPFGLLEFVGITLSVGIFPLLVLLYFNERRLNANNQKLAQSFGQKPVLESVPIRTISIQAETSKDPTLTLQIEELLYAVAENNYVTIHFQRNGEPGRRLLRLSLKRLLDQLADHSSIERCHRSYLINRTHLLAVEGNARSLYLKLHHTDTLIPVSRSLARNFLAADH
ncbi:MAG: LytTR family DNA-binding domain-containing protein [Bacteroidota bacterium]